MFILTDFHVPEALAVEFVTHSIEKSCKKLSFKKRKIKEAMIDYALEDTANSLVTNSKEFESLFLNSLSLFFLIFINLLAKNAETDL